MKHFKQLIALTIIALFFVACGSGSKRNSNFLPPVEIEIPRELADNPDAVKLIESSEKALNEFSDNLETVMYENKDIWKEKDFEDLSTFEKITFAKTMAVIATNSTEMAKVVEKINGLEDEEMFKNLNEKQLKAFEKIGEELDNRMDQINGKYKKIFEKQ